jgi:hypothetical protein
VATIRLPDALTSSAPVSRRAFATTLGAGALAIAAIASTETLLSRSSWALSSRASASSRDAAGGAQVATWTLAVIRGAVSLDLTRDILDRFETVTRVVSAPQESSTVLRGVALADLLSAVGSGSGVRVRATGSRQDGSVMSVVLSPAETAATTTMIATAKNGRALDPVHGGPAQLVVARTAVVGRLIRLDVLG